MAPKYYSEKQLERMDVGELNHARRLVMRHLEELELRNQRYDLERHHTKVYTKWIDHAGVIVAMWSRKLRMERRMEERADRIT